MKEQGLLSSTAAAEKLGVTVSTVKRWADEGLLPHVRTAGGHRRFRALDVSKMTTPDQSFSDQWVERLVSNPDPYSLRGELLSFRGELGSWCDVADALGTVLVTIGSYWRAGKLSIEQEHIASACLSRALASCADSIPLSPKAPTCTLVVPEREEHTLGLSLLEPCLRELGWRTVWLGRNTPNSVILNYIGRHKPEALAVSASSYTHSKGDLETLAEILGKASQSHNGAVLLGGSGEWPESPKYGHRLYAYRELYTTLNKVKRS
jgi:MerR family transcriptional regulator, light-induced transcriptional regulator